MTRAETANETVRLLEQSGYESPSGSWVALEPELGECVSASRRRGSGCLILPLPGIRRHSELSSAVLARNGHAAIRCCIDRAQ